MPTMLRLLRPLEHSWKQLARLLLPKEKQYKVGTIDSDCNYRNTSHDALDDVFNKWLQITGKDERIWQTLCSFAEEYKDDSLEKYIKEKNFKSKFQYDWIDKENCGYNHNLYYPMQYSLF